MKLPGDTIECISLGSVREVRTETPIFECPLTIIRTGTKCLAVSALPKCYGSVLHDSHAEILALRGFNRWVLNEVEALLTDSTYSSPYLRKQAPNSFNIPTMTEGRPFSFKDDVSFHLFTTEAPCGDASMELLMKSKEPSDAVPWAGLPAETTSEDAGTLLGRGYFSQLGQVRRKPARGDAEVSMSKSCTDKLAVKQFISLLSFPADIFVAQTATSFLQSMVVYEDQYDEVGYERAFGPTGRLSSFGTAVTTFFAVGRLPFSFERFAFEKGSDVPPRKVSNVSALWIRSSGNKTGNTSEVLLNGVKQGYKQFDDRSGKQSVICRRQMWLLGRRLAEQLVHATHQNSKVSASAYLYGLFSDWLASQTYQAAKYHTVRETKVQQKTLVTQTMGSWPKNAGDGAWSL